MSLESKTSSAEQYFKSFYRKYKGVDSDVYLKVVGYECKGDELIVKAVDELGNEYKLIYVKSLCNEYMKFAERDEYMRFIVDKLCKG